MKKVIVSIFIFILLVFITIAYIDLYKVILSDEYKEYAHEKNKTELYCIGKYETLFKNSLIFTDVILTDSLSSYKLYDIKVSPADYVVTEEGDILTIELTNKELDKYSGKKSKYFHEELFYNISRLFLLIYTILILFNFLSMILNYEKFNIVFYKRALKSFIFVYMLLGILCKIFI